MGFLDTIKNLFGGAKNVVPPAFTNVQAGQQQQEQESHDHSHDDHAHAASSAIDIAGFNPDDENSFFNAILHMESEGQFGGTDESRAEICSRFGIRDRMHWQSVRDSMFHLLSQKHGSFEEVSQRQMNWRQAQMTQHMQQQTAGAAASGLMNPVEGVTLAAWAAINAAIIGGGNAEDLIKGAGINPARWQRVSDEWNARMARDTTFAITTAYGNAFQAASQGKYAAYVKDAMAARAANRDCTMAPPMSVEQYWEILYEQSFASNAGKDPVAALKAMNLTIVDWTDLGAYYGYYIQRTWAHNIAQYQASMKAAEAKVAARYPGGKADVDIQF
jgi:hypothetical protein